MAFDPRGTNYAAMLRQRAGADRGLTEAKRRKGERDREARIKESGKRSGLQKLASAALRGGAAWATGGASEIYGGGDLIDEVMLGTDSTGRPVRNEYGQLIKAGSGIYHGMKGQKAADIAKKRASNIKDYERDVDYAEKLGELDKDQGIMALNKARQKRAAQIAQTAKADKRGVWGWDNEYDPLELSSSVLKGKDVADKIVEGEPDAPSVRPERYQGLTGEELDKGGRERREQNLLRSRISDIEPERDRGPSGEELDKGVGDRDRKLSFLANKELDRQEDPLLTESIKKRRAIDEMMDGEMSKKLRNDYMFTGDGRLKRVNTGKTKPEYAADKIAEIDMELGGYTQDKPSQTYLDKKPKEDSEKGRVGTLDDMAIDERVKNLKKQDWWDRTFKRSDEDDQLLLEDRIKSERALKKKLAPQPKPYGRADYEGSLYRPFESALKKRIRKRREKEARTAKARGGILAQIS